MIKLSDQELLLLTKEKDIKIGVDKLHELGDKEVKNVYQGKELFDFKHYIIHFEDYGCYEFIARDVYNGIEEIV